ncbi:hypothetical protein Patl1_35475 [Pistacia atlantica]|nr:hypothetical protein Patl1_35475 [Pistacia atlantica]
MNKNYKILPLCIWVCILIAEGDPVRVPEGRKVYADGKMFDISHRVTVDSSAWDSEEGLGQFLWPLSTIKNGSLANASESKCLCKLALMLMQNRWP